jgi:hypothetical protein
VERDKPKKIGIVWTNFATIAMETKRGILNKFAAFAMETKKEGLKKKMDSFHQTS